MADADRHLRRHPLNSLATKLILFVFATTFATAAIVSWNAIQSIRSHQEGLLERRYARALEHGGELLAARLGVCRADLANLADKDADRDVVAEILADSGCFTSIGRLRADGTSLGKLGDDEIPPAEIVSLLASAENGWWERAGWGIAAVVPGLAPRNHRGAIWWGRVADGNLEAAVGDALDGLDASVMLLDADGNPLLPTGDDDAARARLPLERMLASPDRIREYTLRGHHWIGAARPLALQDWNLAVEQPFEVAFAPLLAVVTRTFLIDLFLVLLFSYLAYRITTAVVRPIETLSDGARRIAQGQFDLEITEPARHDEIGLLTRTFNDMMRRLRRYQSEIETANERLITQNEILSQLSVTDGLTGLHNHRFFQDHLTREIKRVTRAREPLSMLLIDIDDFKRLNDRLGHAAGDELLSGMARIMSNCVRDSDLLARYGGEEFVVLASNTDIDGARLIAEKVRTSISESSFILDDSMRPARVTVSIGVAEYRGNRKKFFEAADRALYCAKAEGKDCVVVDDSQETPPPD